MYALKAILKVLSIVILVITYSVSFNNVDASSIVIVVPADCPTIQTAIDGAPEGATILVMPGKYVECIKIKKPLKLIGSGVNITMLENAGDGHTVEITKEAHNVFFKNFTVQCSVEGRWTGISVRGHNHNLENNFVTGHYYGIQIYDSSNNTLRSNILTNNTYNFGVWGLFLSHFLHDIDFSNLAGGKTILYWINQHEKSVPLDVGYVAIINSSRITVKDLNITNNLSGILLAYTNNSLIINVNASKNGRGLYLVNSHSNLVIMSNFSDNEWSGISAISSSNNFFAGNDVTQNKYNGFRISHSFNLLKVLSENNTIIGNKVNCNRDGLYLEMSNNNVIRGNSFIGNARSGIVSDESHGNVIRKNIIKSSQYGIRTLASRDIIYNNAFVNNAIHVFTYKHSPTLSVWDGGYPLGGNYWSDYEIVDQKSGVNQDKLGADGIGDSPYIIDGHNQDRYPLLFPSLEKVFPVVNFVQESAKVRVGEQVVFSDKSFDIDGQILLSVWKIDKDYYWMCKELYRLFEGEKTYAITLIVYDDDGAMNSTTKMISVHRFTSSLILIAPDYANVGETLKISARIFDEEDNPIVNAVIQFYLIDNFSEEFIGYASTDLSGTATFYYTVKREGNFKVKSVFPGNQKYTSSSVSEGLIVKERNPNIFGIFVVFLVIFVLSTLLKFRRLIKVSKNETRERVEGQIQLCIMRRFVIC